jgi:hypothetical protein
MRKTLLVIITLLLLAANGLAVDPPPPPVPVGVRCAPGYQQGNDGVCYAIPAADLFGDATIAFGWIIYFI